MLGHVRKAIELAAVVVAIGIVSLGTWYLWAAETKSPARPTVSRSGRHSSWPAYALKPSDVLRLPGNAGALRVTEAMVVTLFSDKCPVAAQSTPVWNMFSDGLGAKSVPYTVIGCGASEDELEAFGRRNLIKARLLFGGSCEALEPFAKLNGGIRHYAVNAEAKVTGAWEGMPIVDSAARAWLDEMLALTAR